MYDNNLEIIMRKCFCLLVIIFVFCLAGSIRAYVKDAQLLVSDIHWLGHDTFKITGEKVIYTDPFRIKAKDTPDRADIILITHEHHDHCSVEDVKKIQGPNTVIVTTPSCAEKLSGNVRIAKRGDVMDIGGIRIEAVPAYNVNKKFYPKEKDGVGFIFTIKGKRIYLAGDTDHIPEMKTFKNINIALLPVSGTYVMTAEEAVQAALDMKPDVAIPMHYGTIIGTKMNAELFAEGLRGKVEVVILKEE
jgi:L-ascorbate metabolism protein UlaG (beta-lactamase superfamily)